MKIAFVTSFTHKVHSAYKTFACFVDYSYTLCKMVAKFTGGLMELLIEIPFWLDNEMIDSESTSYGHNTCKTSM